MNSNHKSFANPDNDTEISNMCWDAEIESQKRAISATDSIQGLLEGLGFKDIINIPSREVMGIAGRFPALSGTLVINGAKCHLSYDIRYNQIEFKFYQNVYIQKCYNDVLKHETGYGLDVNNNITDFMGGISYTALGNLKGQKKFINIIDTLKKHLEVIND